MDSLTIFNKKSSEEYAGHYILLLKYDQWTDEFLYLNPAASSGKALFEYLHFYLLLFNAFLFTAVQRIDSALLDIARKHVGTDEDLILCYLPPKKTLLDSILT